MESSSLKESDVQMCMSMGFSRSRAIAALKLKKGSVELAIEHLLNENDQQQQSSSSSSSDASSLHSSPAASPRFSSSAATAAAAQSSSNDSSSDEAVAQIISFGFPAEVARQALREHNHDLNRALESLVEHADLYFDQAEEDEVQMLRMMGVLPSQAGSSSSASASLSKNAAKYKVSAHKKDKRKFEKEAKESFDPLQYGDYVHLFPPSTVASFSSSSLFASSKSSSSLLIAEKPHAKLVSTAVETNLSLGLFRILHPLYPAGPGSISNSHSVTPSKPASISLSTPNKTSSSTSSSSSAHSPAAVATAAAAAASSSDSDFMLRQSASILIRCEALDTVFLSIEGDHSASCIREGVPADFFMKWQIRVEGAAAENHMLPIRSGDRVSLSSALRKYLNVAKDDSVQGTVEPAYWTIRRVDPATLPPTPDKAAAAAAAAAASATSSLAVLLTPRPTTAAGSNATPPALTPSSATALSTATAAGSGSLSLQLTPARGSSFSSSSSSSSASSTASPSPHTPHLVPVSPFPPSPSVDADQLQKSGDEWWRILRNSYRLAALRLQRVAIQQVREKLALDARKLERARAANAEKQRECVSCWEAPPDTVLLECGHICMCRTCAPAAKNCPLCRKPIARVIVQKR